MLNTARRRQIEPTTSPTAEAGDGLLAVDDLTVEYGSGPARTQALRAVSLRMHAGQILGVAGESGSGKTTTALAAMGLLPRGTTVRGSISYHGVDLLALPERRLRQYRGRHLAMIFQETASALNPVIRVGDQLTMAARAHARGGRAQVRDRVRSALADVRLHDADRVMSSYPHELSGGMCQRVIIAMALSCGSEVLFADEPTTALDVSVQKEILDLLGGLVARRRLAVMLISHDLAVLSEVCDELVVMYQGRIAESGVASRVLKHPEHPYTQALIDCIPTMHGRQEELHEISPARRALIDAHVRGVEDTRSRQCS